MNISAADDPYLTTVSAARNGYHPDGRGVRRVHLVGGAAALAMAALPGGPADPAAAS